MYKIVIELLLVTLILNEAICFPTKHQILLSEKNQTSRVSRHPMRRRICTIKFRLMPKMALSFTTDFMMFKRPRIVCLRAKTQSKNIIPKNVTTTTKSPTITTTTRRVPKLCTFHIEFASLFNFCNSYLRTWDNCLSFKTY